MTAGELLVAIPVYLASFGSLFYAITVLLVGLAVVDLIVGLVRGSWR